MIKKEEFPKLAKELLATAQAQVKRWEERLETLEEKENPNEEQLDKATRHLEAWESITENMEEIEEILDELKQQEP